MKSSFLFNNADHSNTTINKSRIPSYDIIRGLAVLFMILIHVTHIYALPYIDNSIIGYCIEFMGGPPAAPTFMLLMGIFFIYANKGSTKQSLLRGLNILLIAYVLNLVRGILPYYFVTELQGTPIEHLDRYLRLEYLIFEVDILTFAGISYMLMAVIYQYVKKPVYWLTLAVVIAIGSPILWQIEVNSLPLQYIVNVLWGDEYLSTFPLFPWLVFPLIGMVLGRKLMLTHDHKQLFTQWGYYAIPLLMLGGLLMLWNIEYFYNAYGKMGVGAIIAMIGFFFFWQWLITKLYNKANKRVQTGFLRFTSKYVLQVYFVHWVLCSWGVVLFGKDSMDYPGIFLMFFAITILTTLIVFGYSKLNEKGPPSSS